MPWVRGHRNGRSSRLLSTLCLYRAEYDFKRLFTISECYDRDRPAFYAAISGVREGGMDLTGWLDGTPADPPLVKNLKLAVRMLMDAW